MLRMSRAMLCGMLAIMALQSQGGLVQAKSQEKVAVSAVVTGNDQRVGFRALVMKQAIRYNLAGTAKNAPDNIVEFVLQGRQSRIDEALQTIRDGTRKSSNIDVKTASKAVDPKLDTFSVVDWTSTSRQITTPYTLVFRLRDTDESISKAEAKSVWHDILKTTLKGDDLQKLGDDD